MSTVGSDLLNEIERVSAKRERWKGYAEVQDNFSYAVMLMTMAIDNGKRAIAEDDAVASIAALKALRDFDSDD